MKLIKLICLLVLFTSCSDDVQESLTDVKENLATESLHLEAADSVAIIEKLERTLSAATPGQKITFQTSEVKEIEGAYYLIARNDEYVSTTLLKEGDDNTLVTAGISCTSKACSGSSTSCVPKSDGKSCTPCLTGDCTKTVTEGHEEPE
ncbi:hypothetical protein CLV24_111103 [Pontibacter ummariensis]|uniref:Uncharacterized protein n=1 Tax=Pontibacter ummariensis TaxID=1610492 RepID=A0A239GJV7_9BACT|nr:hypothetical protein [Pontibacter ummariensis]PRY11308.1 hypothetical protein CLV24_111103 [Pontibacter ummariensis]SNS69449.1 hypothetical protein SAMN06296052_111103 [Pontibacter ummariensis]